MAPPRISVLARMSDKKEIRNGCWIWTGAATSDGYGVMGVGRNNQQRVHRLSFEHFIGPIPKGMFVCHRCDTPLCFNPDHLFLGSPRDNTRDMIRKGRRASIAGEAHPNTKIAPDRRDVIRARRASGESLKSIAADYGVAFQTISAICRGEKNYAAR